MKWAQHLWGDRALFTVLRRGLLALSLFAALVMGAPGHRVPAAIAPDLLAFFAAGGTFADLCADHDAGSAGGSHRHNDCPLCRVGDAPLLSKPWQGPVFTTLASAAPQAQAQALVRVFAIAGPALGSRAPPYA